VPIKFTPKHRRNRRRGKQKRRQRMSRRQHRSRPQLAQLRRDEPHINVSRLVVTGATVISAVVEALQNGSICSQRPRSAKALDLPLRPRARYRINFGIGLALSAGDPDGLPFDFLYPKRPRCSATCGIRILAGTAALRRY